MALVRTITPDALKQAFIDFGRDYFSYEACEALVNLFEETDRGTDTELDVIALCCDFTESDPGYVYDNYNNLDDIAECTFGDDADGVYSYPEDPDEDKLFEALSNHTWVVRLDNGNFLYQTF